jgi:hypothetical protein
MDVIHKDATITPTGVEGDMPGTFEVILSAPTLDRDGDTLATDGWKTPLPEHITFDSDHGMSVATTVGSGVPSIDEKTGNLVVSGTYSSLARAQEVRTLVNEGHIRTTSVAFMSEKSTKDGKSVIQRELLNGAFVAIPSNREALVLSSKAAKSGARNSAADMSHVQGIHDAAAMGADCAGAKSFTRKDGLGEDDADPASLALAVDASLDQALELFAEVDPLTLPAEIQQAIALVVAADVAIDELLDVVGIPDPDEDAADSGVSVATASGVEKSAPVAAVKDAPVEDADSDAVTTKQLEALALRIQAEQFI